MTGDDLRAARRRLGLTQAAFADRVGVHPNTIARYERDEIPVARPVAQLAALLQAAPHTKGGPTMTHEKKERDGKKRALAPEARARSGRRR